VPPFRAPFLGAVEQLRDGAAMVGRHRRICPPELAQQRRAKRQVQIVGGAQQPPLLLPRWEPRHPALEALHLASVLDARFCGGSEQVGVSTRRKLINAASDAEGPSRPWGTRGSGVSGSSSPACTASSHAR
jgi:hypothetical protein